MTTANATDLAAGTKIFYTGDVANQEGVFVVVKQYVTDYGLRIDLREIEDEIIDEPREWIGLTLTAFEAGPGCRFMLHDEWMAERASKLAAFVASVQ